MFPFLCNKTLGLFAAVLVLSASPVFAAPAAPAVRTPGSTVPTGALKQTAQQHPAVTSQPAATTQPTATPQPQSTKSEASQPTVTTQPAPADTAQPSPATPAPSQKQTAQPMPAASATVKPAAEKTAPPRPTAPPAVATKETKKPDATDKANRAKTKSAVTAGHPFRIQDKEENYKSRLSKSVTQRLDAALSDMIGGTGEKVPGLAVIVFKDGKEVYRNMMGNRFLSPRNKNWNLPVTSDSFFRVASISKMFTATGYMQLVEQGKIDLDEDVSRYLGFTLRNPNYPNKAITSRMLLSHTSSIRDYPTPYVPFKSSVQSFFKTENCWTKSSVPGAYFSYSNLNFVLLATILERISGQRFDKYITKNVLKPLDCKGSFNLRDFSSSDLQKMGTIYRKTKGESGRYYAQIDDRPIELPDASRLASYRPGTNAGIFSPQGGLRITPESLSHLLQMMMNRGNYNGKQILKSDTVKLMETQVWKYDPARRNGDFENDSIESYGLALQYFSGTGATRPAPNRPDFHLIGHLGEAYGFIGGVMWQPGTKNGFLFLQNGFATPYKQNKGRYSKNFRWEENFMKAIIENVFPK